VTIASGSPESAGGAAAMLGAWPGAPAGLAPAGAFGWALATMTPGEARDSYSMDAGVTLWTACTAAVTAEISTLGVLLVSGGVTSSGVNVMGIADRQGDLIEVTGSMTTALGSAGFAEGDLPAPCSVVQGATYYLGLLCNFSVSGPGAAGRAGPIVPPVPGGEEVVPAVILTGQTSLVSFTPGSGNAFSGYLFGYGR
jgi:hypothetical protein